MASSAEVLSRAGYEVVEVLRLPASEPGYAEMHFDDVHPGFSSTRLRGRRLYAHQLEAFRALESGGNIVLVSGTGSGKTEAWLLWVAARAREGRRARVVVVYPTLALAWDQMARLQEYSNALGIGVVGVDSTAKREVRGLRGRVRESWIVATNPAMLLVELKKHLVKPGSSILSPALEELDLLVVDELDYYDPRALSLLLGMIEILSNMNRGRLAVAVLSATIANPEDLARYLEEVTGRPARIIRGEPFRVESRIYVVLGKNLEAVRRRLLELSKGEELPDEIRRALEDPGEFAGNAYKVTQYFESRGYEVPSIAPDPVEILEYYARDTVEPHGLTLVFTRSINEAERLARQLRERLAGRGLEGSVAAHHHLVPKDARRRVEEAARRGEVRVIITPRTLTQGIDIGTVVRIVHMGLPEDVREFWQREGRKGRRWVGRSERRGGKSYTESLIIPRAPWDRTLLSQGLNALQEWLRLPLERVEVNPGNHYKALLTGAAKLYSRHPGLGSPLTEVEREALKAAGVIDSSGSVKPEALRRLWEHLNFYEYGPPYGVKRVLELPEGRRELSEVGRCDLVEKFQPGCLDPGHDAIVVRLVHPRDRPSRVQRIVEKRLEDAVREGEPDWLMDAIEEYRSLKEGRWGERARLLRDYHRGLLASEVETVVYPPRRGFGLLTKKPHRCQWIVTGERPEAIVGADGSVRVFRRREYLYIDSPVAGIYRDYTYGVLVEAPEGSPPDMLRLGLATLGVYLRVAEGVPLGLLKYSVYSLGERRVLEVHEESAAGLLDRLDWSSVAARVREWTPGRLDEILLLALDEVSYSILQSLAFNWEHAKAYASLVAGVLATRQSIVVTLSGRRVRVPRPSRSLGRAVVVALSQAASVAGIAVPFTAYTVVYYDGERVLEGTGLVPAPRALASAARPPEELALLELSILQDILYSDVRLYAFNPQVEARELERLGLRLLAREIASRALSLKELAARLGLRVESPSWLIDAVEVEGGQEVEEPDPRDLEQVSEALSKPLGRAVLPRSVAERMRRYAVSYAKLVYLASLALERLLGEGGGG